MKDARSPLKDRPLRLPGQSLLEERRALLDYRLEPWFMTALFMLALAALEWFRFLTAAPFNPILFSVVAVAFTVVAV